MKKADVLFQEVGLKRQPKCLNCGKPATEIHHHIPKSICSALRYDLQNAVSLCHTCHIRCENGDKSITEGYKKHLNLDYLETKKHEIISVDSKFYEDAIRRLKTIRNAI